jgi:hypothetical protein
MYDGGSHCSQRTAERPRSTNDSAQFYLCNREERVIQDL